MIIVQNYLIKQIANLMLNKLVLHYDYLAKNIYNNLFFILLI